MNSDYLTDVLRSERIEATAPCRIDMGGTLDISTFYYPLAHANPCTFNIAISKRTRVLLDVYKKDWIKVSSKGFESAAFPLNGISFNHPLGLIFAIAGYFRIGGIHIQIESGSPPRSALGGSSSAAVALIGAYRILLQKMRQEIFTRNMTPILAHAIEESVAGVPCGLQDQLAAYYGGIHAWYWHGVDKGNPYTKEPIGNEAFIQSLGEHVLVAYCGAPHESKNINGRWISQFLSGYYYGQWAEILKCTQMFIQAFKLGNFTEAAEWMNQETGIRLELTPDVFDATGQKLADAAYHQNCGVRFTGAGGGGCIWTIGDKQRILQLKQDWAAILEAHPTAHLMDFDVDTVGLQ